MKVGVLSAFMDYHRTGGKNRGPLQPLIGPYIAALLPPEVEVEVINETWQDPDWNRSYDLLFVSSLHPDFDRARQVSNYWRRRGAKTVYGGNLASTYPNLCRPFFDAVAVGDPEGCVPQIFRDFVAGELKPLYVAPRYDPEQVPTPRFDLLVDRHPVPLSLEATRGCPFTCDFCALTALGTRHHTRSPARVVEDIRTGQRVLRGRVAGFKTRIVSFVDNNIGGNLRFLRELCEALTPLGVRWGSAITFNVVAELETVKMLSRSGCRFLFIGLESFNPVALADMHKVQNSVDKIQATLDHCRRHGILVFAGLMVSPVIDDCGYLKTVPERLRQCGLHMPTFISFEAPIPGTPHFHRLAEEPEPALLPNALLRDFTGYSLVTRPRREPVGDFIAAYRSILDATYRPAVKLHKLMDDGWRFLANGFWVPAVADLVQLLWETTRQDPNRTYVTGSDTPPPEASSVPLTEGDFVSDQERRSVLAPWRVADERGRVLPAWRRSTRVFDPKGRLTREANQLLAAAGG